jgi:hypothetical protein
MQTTLVNPAAVAGSGKGTNPKTTLYVGGLEETVNEALLHAAFLPFGEIKDVNIPLDHASGKNRGFGFVEYEEKEDAAAAIDNMHNSELNGRVLKVNYAQPMKVGKACSCLPDVVGLESVVYQYLIHDDVVAVCSNADQRRRQGMVPLACLGRCRHIHARAGGRAGAGDIGRGGKAEGAEGGQFSTTSSSNSSSSGAGPNASTRECSGIMMLHCTGLCCCLQVLPVFTSGPRVCTIALISAPITAR